MSRNSSVTAYRASCGKKMPSPRASTGSPPVTTLISSRPFEMRSSVAVMRAATAGSCKPGRTATRNLNRSVSGTMADAMTQESSQDCPVGSSTPK